MDQKLHHKKMEESQKKLTSISVQMDAANRQEMQWTGIDQVAEAIEELQALISWIAEKKGVHEDNSVILQKLQQLSKIRKILEKSAIETQQNRVCLQDIIPPPDYVFNENEGQTSSDLIAHSNQVIAPSIASVSYPEILPPESQGNCNRNAASTRSRENAKSTVEANKKFDSENISLYLKKLCSLVPPGMVDDVNREPPDDSHDSLGTAISEDEGLGEESRRGDPTGPNSFFEMSDPPVDIGAVELSPTLSLKHKEPVSPSVKRREQSSWIRDSWCHRNSIELCLATISKLKESLHLKESEIVELKKLSQTQKDIKECQSTINNLQRNAEELKSSVSALEKENSTLKESLLELEEAENDARLKGQRVEEKLIFLQQKDSHFQAELSETKQALKLCLEELSLKDADERELRSQLKFMEILVQKYEEQVKTLEVVEASSQKLKKSNSKKSRESPSNKGTQTCFEQELLDKKTDKRVLSGSGSNLGPGTMERQKNALSFKNVSIQADYLTDSWKSNDGGREFETAVPRNMSTPVENQSPGSEDDSLPANARDMRLVTSSSCIGQMELIKRMHHLVAEDADLQEQLNHVDQINNSLWQKLHSLQFHIGECQDESSDKDEFHCLEKAPDNNAVLPVIPHPDMLEVKKCPGLVIPTSFDYSEEKLKERLSQLEKINASFLKKLETREKLYLEQERRHEKWLKMEDQLTGDLKSLGVERDSLLAQVTQLEVEKLQLSSKVKALETELSLAREKHLQEATKITEERDEIMASLQKTIDDLIVREKEYLKQIAKLKSTRNRQEEKMEFESLKSSYVQLQIELVGYRDQMENTRNEFDGQLGLLKESHSREENRLLDQLGVFRDRDSHCDKTLGMFQGRQMELERCLQSKELDLEKARKDFKLHMRNAEEEHKAVEAELRKKLSQMEEGTAFATKALTEERVRLERELQDNIDDLKSKEELYKSRILELESNVSQLHQELHRLTGNLQSKFDSNENFRFQREHLLNELHELRVREGELREKLEEMEKKESAYRETLEHADRIVASVERGYKNKIEELEMSERCLKQRVGYLEEVENRLRVALQKERRSCDGRRPDELIVELAEAEKREHSLKEEIGMLDLSNRSATNRVRELEKVQQKLESQLSDHDDLATSLEKLQYEQESIRKELTKLRKSETNLQLALHQTESVLETREAEIGAELKRFDSEKRELEETISQLRSQVRDLKEKMEKRLVDDESEGETLDKNIPFSVGFQSPQDKGKSGVNSTSTEAIGNIYSGVSKKEINSDATIAVSSTVANAVASAVSSTVANTATSTVASTVANTASSTVASTLANTASSTVASAVASTVTNNVPVFTNITSTVSSVLEACSPTPSTTNMAPARNIPKSGKQNIPIKEDFGQRGTVPHDALGATGTTRAEKEYNEVRLQLEECMMRAMDAMKMEMEHKTVEFPVETDKSEVDSILPPFNFHVVQQVGSDTLLVGWEYSDVPNLEGFELYVNDQLHETVYAPDRRKAVISGFDLSKELVLSICSVSTTGQVSKPQILELPQNNKDGFFFQDDDDDDDDELFDDDVGDKQLRPYSVDW